MNSGNEILDDMLWVQTIRGHIHPVRRHGRDPEAVAALASADLGEPVKVVRRTGDSK